MPKYTKNLNLSQYGTTPEDLASSVRSWRTELNGYSNDNMTKIDAFAGEVIAKNAEQDTKISTLETNTTNLGTGKYDNVTHNSATGELTFLANGASKKTIKTGIPDAITLDKLTKTKVNFISSETPAPMSYEYGVKVDLDANTITRLGGASGKTLDDFYNFAPWSNIRREIIEGQYMVKIPKFYYKRVATKTEKIPFSVDGNEIGDSLIIWEDWISPTQLDGYFVHPAFVRDGMIQDFVYMSAFEGSIYDTSANAYLLEDEQVADFNTDLLCSIPNAKPCSGKTQNLTIEMTRKLANNRNTNSNFKWFQQDFSLTSAIQMLIVVSIGSYNCQANIGKGVTDILDAPNTDNNSLKTGETLSMGIRCGSAGAEGASSVNYFGIENFWGNIWKFVDGINVEGKTLNQVWVNDDDLTNDTSVNKNNLGFTMSKESGYMSKIGYTYDADFCYLPSETKSGKVISNDYFYQNSTSNGFLIARLGGGWYYGSYAGCFSWAANASASYRARELGARLACIIK